MVDFKFKQRYDFQDLVEIVRILRAPGGCPWDREQTHESLKPAFIEETYEAVEAINKGDSTLMCEELGDCMLQVVFHADIEREGGSFDINDVTDGICKKLIERHPHVFGSVKAETSEQVLDNWDAIKRRSKGQKTQGSAMLKVPRELPALMRAQKLQGKAKKAGFDWPDVQGAYDALYSELEELKSACESADGEDVAMELGDVLFSVVNIARFLGVDAEQALCAGSDKFMRRFLKVEELAAERGIILEASSLEVLDELWNEAKQRT